LYKVIKSSAQGIPLGAQADLDDFKIIFLDTGLSQALLQLDITPWFIDPINTFINKGELIEAFVGQEKLAYSDPIAKETLFYWRRENRASQAEVDYVVQISEHVVPIKVKAGKSKRIKSMQLFLDSHLNCTYGLRFSADNYSKYQKILSYPLYATAKPFIDASNTLHKALINLAEV
jgi:predicted AAA+ superfamily ATPase